MPRSFIRGALLGLTPLLAGCSSPPPPPPADLGRQELSVASMLDVLWEWVETGGSTDRTAPDDPSLYTIRFEPGVRVMIRADCNRGIGKYTLTGPSIKVDPRAMTQSKCAADSKDYVFLRNLEDAHGWEIVGGELHFGLRSNAATMRFRPAPPKES